MQEVAEAVQIWQVDKSCQSCLEHLKHLWDTILAGAILTLKHHAIGAHTDILVSIALIMCRADTYFILNVHWCCRVFAPVSAESAA